jgi:hypothetical protein
VIVVLMGCKDANVLLPRLGYPLYEVLLACIEANHQQLFGLIHVYAKNHVVINIIEGQVGCYGPTKCRGKLRSRKHSQSMYVEWFDVTT